MVKEKKCSKCGLVKPRSEFHKSSKLKSGLMSWCKQCRHKKYLENHLENLRRARNNRMTKEEKREYYRKNRVRCSKYHKKYYLKTKMMVFTHYGDNPPKCACCGETIIQFLTVDHIHGDGNKHRRRTGMKNSLAIYLWLIKNNFPEGFQILCYNCNCGRAHNNGICPHKQLRDLSIL